MIPPNWKGNRTLADNPKGLPRLNLTVFCIAAAAFVILTATPGRSSTTIEYSSILPDDFWDEKLVDSTRCLMCQKIADLINMPGYLENLANPVFSSREAVRMRNVECNELLALHDDLMPIALDLRTCESLDDAVLKAVNFYFAVTVALHFNMTTRKMAWFDKIMCAGDSLFIKVTYGGAPLDTAVVLGAAMDAYCELTETWNRWGLEAPPGFTYLWVTPDATGIRYAFELDENVTAACLACRFIAIPWSGKPEHFRMVVKHELVHVFCNCLLGYARNNDLPKWWNEGLAVLLSGDHGGYVIDITASRDQNGRLARRLVQAPMSDEYLDWERCFRFLRCEYGDARLGRFVKRSLESASVDTALAEVLDMPSDSALFATVDAGLYTWNRRQLLVVVYYLVMLGIGIGSWRERGLLVAASVLLPLSVALLFISRLWHFPNCTPYPAISTWIFVAVVTLLAVAVVVRRLTRA